MENNNETIIHNNIEDTNKDDLIDKGRKVLEKLNNREKLSQEDLEVLRKIIKEFNK